MLQQSKGESSLQKRLHIKIYGRIQGVGFRFSAEKKARELSLSGWVRNCDDGCVETEVEGESSAVEEYMEWCWKGPISAKVEKMEEDWISAEGKFKKFEIKY